MINQRTAYSVKRTEKEQRKGRRLNAQRSTLYARRASQAGFVLMLASLVASLLAALGIAMFTIAQKEIVLSSLGRDSQFAFYAADTGAECALYWDFKYDAFNTSQVYASSTSATCAGQVLQDFPTSGDEGSSDGASGLGGTAISTFWFEPDGLCVKVTVEKQNENPRTKVEALGYSTACDDPNNRRRLERAVRATF